MRRYPFRGSPQPQWMRDVKAGDVLVSPSGMLRVVRGVARYSCGALSSLDFAIRRCSWTRRGHTVYGYTDLKHWSALGVSVPLTSKLDRLLEADANATIAQPSRVSCCRAADMP